MVSPTFGWESQLQTDAPPGCSLIGGLFTTYDRADERLLVEHFLPLLLNLGREFESEGIERQYFLLELDARLKSLHDKLVVVSSTMRDEAAGTGEDSTSPYGWIWRSIRQLTVGHRGKAVQHAKLWLLHWQTADESNEEYIEIVVSSANLTMDAFRGQLQGAWRACVKLQPQATKARLAGWGIVPEFLRELAISAGEENRLSSFVDLLARAECPNGVVFVASVPGTHSRQVLRRTPWGAAGLERIAPPGRGKVNVSILSPFIGTWSADALNRWCDRFEGSAERLNLLWIEKDHLWAKNWLLPHATMKVLVAEGAKFLHLRRETDDGGESASFHKEHRQTDPRWSHAKAYSFTRGRSHRLLITSANFSTSAWGSENRDGGMTIKNFELGVCVEQPRWPFDGLPAFVEGEVPSTVMVAPSVDSSLILWASAAWDGKRIDLRCRCDENRPITGKVLGDGKSEAITQWALREKSLWAARVAWPEDKGPPAAIQLKCERETLTVAVFDERPWHARANTVPPEIDEDVAQAIQDALLFEQYGGRVAIDDDFQAKALDESLAEDDEGDAEAEDASKEGEVANADSYAVPAFVLARNYFSILDNWSDRLERVQRKSGGQFEQELLYRDGLRLVEAFQRKVADETNAGLTMGLGANLAAEELTQRLKYFPEM